MDMDDLFVFEEAMDEICGECTGPNKCSECPLNHTYRRLLDEEFGEDFPTPYTVHAEDSFAFNRDKEKWLARRHRKADVKAKRQKVKVHLKDTGHLKENRCTIRRKEALNDCD